MLFLKKKRYLMFNLQMRVIQKNQPIKPTAEQSNTSTASEQSITKENNEVFANPSVSAVKPEPPKAEQVKPDAKNTPTEKRE